MEKFGLDDISFEFVDFDFGAWIGLSFGDCWLGQMSHFVKIDCEYYQIYALRILGVEVCV